MTSGGIVNKALPAFLRREREFVNRRRHRHLALGEDLPPFRALEQAALDTALAAMTIPNLRPARNSHVHASF